MASEVGPRQDKYQLFLEKTDPQHIKKSAENLNKLTSLFKGAFREIDLAASGPVHQVGPRQAELDKLSEMKIRLAKSIEFHKDYYENDWKGKIAKFVLKIFGKWHDGLTPSIERAELELLRWDSRNPLIKIKGNHDVIRYLFPLTLNDWVNQNLDTKDFYNYNPHRKIRLRDGSYWDNGKLKKLME